MNRLKAAAAYLFGALAAVAIAGALTPPGSGDLWVIMRLLYYVGFMSLFFSLPALLIALVSTNSRRLGPVAGVVVVGAVLALFFHAWLFNPRCQHASLWEPMCYEGVKSAMAIGADGVAVILVAHAVGVAVWIASLEVK